MAMKSTSLIGLLALGFALLFLGFPWYVGITVIILSLAISVTGEGQAQMVPMPLPIPAAPKAAKKALHYYDQPVTGSVNDPFEFKPTIPPDGIAGIKSISAPKSERMPGDPGNLSLGKRTGAMSLYMDPPGAEAADYQNDARIRIKEDLRINLPFMEKKDINGQISPLKNLVTSHFRTSNPIIRTKMLDKTFESTKTGFDDWAD